MSAEAQLDEQGFVVLEEVLPSRTWSGLRQAVARQYELEGGQAGAEFKQEPGCLRLANLIDKGEGFQQIVAVEAVLRLVQHVLGNELKLSSLNARTALPGSASQPLHADMGALADERGYWVCNTVWLLDAFTPYNGALRAIPGSHRWGRLPQDELPDPKASHRDEVLVTGAAESVIVMNAHLWHGGLANCTSSPRTALHAFYCRRDKPQQQHQKALVRAEVQSRLSLQLRHLLALDDAANDEISSQAVCRSGFLK